MKKRFSLSLGSMIRSLSAVWQRFPVAVVAILASAVMILMEIHDSSFDYRLWLIMSGAVPLGVAGVLAVENRMKRMAEVLTTIGVVAAWVVYCLFLPDSDNDLSTGLKIEIGAIIHAGWAAIFLIAFLGRGKDAAWWNFVGRTFWRMILGGAFAAVLFGGLALAILAVDTLFGVDIQEEIYADLWVFCAVVFAPLYVLAGVPSGAAKFDGELRPARTVKVLGLYILTPIMAVYTLILYLYLLKIVVTWELPNGWVSWLVSVLGLGGLVVMVLLYPFRRQGENRVVDFLSRWTGVIIMPLLVLMSVGILRRVSDYGLTINRCYVLLANVWLYAIYIYLFVRRGRGLRWIPVSLATIVTVSSIGPWSSSTVTGRSITREINNYLEHRQIPVDNPSLVLDITDTVGLTRLSDNLRYLKNNYGKESIARFFSGADEDTHLVGVVPTLADENYDPDRDYEYFHHSENTQNAIHDLGKHYGKFASVAYDEHDDKDERVSFSQTGSEFVILIRNTAGKVDGADDREFRLPIAEIDTMTVFRGDDFLFLMDYCSGRKNSTGTEILKVTDLEGFLFYE